MIRIITGSLLLIHGFIHLMGFAKAWGYGHLKQLTIPISKTTGTLWLIAAMVMIAAALLFLFGNTKWWLPALIALPVSQWVILQSWQDAKWGTLANLLLLLLLIAAWGDRRFESAYKKDVYALLQGAAASGQERITEKDMKHLPLVVQHYLTRAGVMGKPKVRNMRVRFEGKMRNRNQDWFHFTSEQFNFFEEPARLFFMKGSRWGITLPGYHRYRGGNASMDIRLFGLFPLVQKEGPIMDKTETVTFFNDICLMAPAALIDPRIEWQELDSLQVKAVFTHRGIRISATLVFNDSGELINFFSNDRTDIGDMRSYPFSTPCGNYKTFNGYHLITEGDAVWHYPDGPFVYGQFRVKEIEYNVSL